MTFNFLKCMSAVAALAGLTSSASAEIVNVTYTGTVSSVGYSSADVNSTTDGLGLFGGGALTGSKFRLVFTFDTSKVPLSTTIADPVHGIGGFQSLLSGATFGLADAFSPTLLTINGHTQSVVEGVGTDLNNAGHAETGATGLIDSVNGTSGVYSASVQSGIGTSLNPLPVSPGFLAAPSTTSIPACGWGCGGYGFFSVSLGYSVSETVYLNPTVAVVTDGVAAGVPETSTWTMMLLGFAGLGFAGRHTVRKAAALVV